MSKQTNKQINKKSSELKYSRIYIVLTSYMNIKNTFLKFVYNISPEDS